MVESEEPAIDVRWEPPRRMCFDLLYVYLILGFILISLQILNQMAGDFLREYALILTIGVLVALFVFTLYYVSVNRPIRPSEA
ncbi:MAG: hypothetical protein ACXABV_00610 [Candidatus Thorarchaeota archaeon]|jgi:hypothetical protein